MILFNSLGPYLTGNCGKGSFKKQVAIKYLLIENIRPIPLTSIILKFLERVLQARISNFVYENSVLSSCKIGFSPGCSISFAYINLEGSINENVTARVCYGQVEYRKRVRQCRTLSFVIMLGIHLIVQIYSGMEPGVCDREASLLYQWRRGLFF